MPILKSIQYSCWCDKCGNFEDYSEYRNQKAFETELRKLGWHRTADGKWICPEHDKSTS